MASADQLASTIPDVDSTSLQTVLPQLPPIPDELLYLIIDRVPAKHILPFRSVCRSIKEHIDKFVFKSYLHRMTIIGYEPMLEPSALDEGLFAEVARALPFIKFQYSHMDGEPKDHTVQDGAIFKIDPEWLAMYKPWFDSAMSDQDGSEEEQDLLNPVLCFYDWDGPLIVGGPAWFIHLDDIALPMGVGSTEVDDTIGHGHVHVWSPGQVYLNHEAMTVTVNWMLVLRNMLVMEAEIFRRVNAYDSNNSDSIEDESGDLDQSLVSKWSYGPLEDQIRATFREYASRYNIAMFRKYDQEEKSYAEDRLMAGIMRLRQGAQLETAC